MTKRILSFLLAFMLMLSMLPTQAMAAGEQYTVQIACLDMYGTPAGSGTLVDKKPTASVSGMTYYTVTAGEELELSYTLNSGYVVKSITCYQDTWEQEDVPMANNKFTMPANNVIISIVATQGEASYGLHSYPYGTHGLPQPQGQVSFPSTAKYGETVTVSVTPDAGYYVTAMSLHAYDGDTFQGPAPVISVNGNVGTFTMPDENVYVKVDMGYDGGAAQPTQPTEPAEPTQPAEPTPPTQPTQPAEPTQPTQPAEPQTYTIVTPGEITGGSITTDKTTADADQTVTVIIAPAEGYALDWLNVYHGETSVMLNDDNTFTMPADNVDVSGAFKVIGSTKFAVTVADDIENGTVTASASQAEEGEEITLTVTPAEGYEQETLTATYGDNQSVTITDNKFTMPAGDVTVNATFKAVPTYTVTVEESRNGTVTANPTEAEEGKKITLAVTPAEGYVLDALTVKDAQDQDVEVKGSYFTMPASDVVITATFKLKPIHAGCTHVGEDAVPLTQTSGVVPAGSYYLAGDLTLTGILEIKSDVNLCLNGHKLIGCGTKSALEVTRGKLNLDSCVSGGQITGANSDTLSHGSAIYVNGATVNMYGGTITGNVGKNYGTVDVSDRAVFNMYGGSVSGNTLSNVGSYGGGGFYVKGTLNVYGGSITGNYTGGKGGGIYCSSYGTVNLVGGTVSGNSAKNVGQGIFYSSQEGSGGTLYIGGNPNIAQEIYLDNYWATKYPYITSAIKNRLYLTVDTYTEGRVIAQGTESYTLTTTDLARITLKTADGSTYYCKLVPKDNQIIMTAADPGYTLSYYVKYDGNGALGATTDETPYLVGEEATLLASAFTWTGRNFAGWNTEADGSGTTYQPGDKVTLEQDLELYAIWTLADYKVFVTEAQNGNVTVSKTDANAGEQITVIATPAVGYVLDTLTVKDAAGTEITVTDGEFTMPAANVTVSATFKAVAPTTYTVTVADDIQNGTVTADKTTAAAGETITVTTTPAEGYELDTITAVDASGASITVTEGKFTMPAANVTVTATFKAVAPTTYTVTVADDIENGTVTASASQAEEGEEITLTITPAEGYELETLTATYGDNQSVTVTEGKFTMPAANVTVSAVFKRSFTVTGEKHDGSTGNGSFSVELTEDGTYRIVGEPDEKSFLDGIMVDGEIIRPNPDGTYTLPQGRDVVVEFLFTKGYVAIPKTGNAGGSVSVNKDLYRVGDVAFIEVKLEEGYRLVHLYVVPVNENDGNGGSSSATNFKDIADTLDSNGFCYLTMESKDVELYPEFSNTYSLTVTPNKSTVTVDGVKGTTFTLNDGDEPVIEIKPKTGYIIKKVTLNGVNVTSQVKDGKLILDAVHEDLELVVTTQKKAVNPYTGDDFRLHAWLFVLVSSGLTAAYMMLPRRKGRHSR